MYKCKLKTADWSYDSELHADFIALLRSYNFSLVFREDSNKVNVVGGGSVEIDSLDKLFSLIDLFGYRIIIGKSTTPEYTHEITIYDYYLE